MNSTTQNYEKEESYYYDDYYYYSEGFDNYDRTSIDPGPYMIISVSLYSLLCVIVLPFIVGIAKRREEKKSKRKDRELQESRAEKAHKDDEDDSDSFIDSPMRINLISRDSDISLQNESSIGGSSASRLSTISRRHKRTRRREDRNGKVAMLDFTKIIDTLNNRQRVGPEDIEVGSIGTNGSESKIDLSKYGVDFSRKIQDEEHGEKKHDNENDVSRKEKEDNSSPCRVLRTIAKYDDETKAIMKLGGPLTLSSVTYDIFDAISTALISRYLGVDALAAYIVTNLLIGLSECLIDGLGSSLNTLCSHAIGMENHKLAGQYVQIASIFYFVLSIPTMGVWWFTMESCIRLFQMNERVVEIGGQYTKLVIFHYIMEGAFDGYTGLLDINGQVLPATIFDIIMSFADMAATWTVVTRPDASLYLVGVSQLIVSAVSMVLFAVISYCKGWLDPFLPGLVRSFAMKNTKAVKTLVTTSIPLSLGYLLSYGEWECLTFIAAFLGPAEVAAWGLLESLWGMLESITYGASEAGCIRLALHLGKGNIELAKQSASKSLFLCSCFSVLISVLIYSTKDLLTEWYTQDETLQTMMLEAIPLVTVGNVLMVFGMVCWSLVGAQGRYRLSTTVNAIVSFSVTLPLSALFCVHYHLSLKALVGAVVTGYSTTGLCFAYILLTSDWEGHSAKIRAANEQVSESPSSDEDKEEMSDSDSDSDSDEGSQCKSAIDRETIATTDINSPMSNISTKSKSSSPTSKKVLIFGFSSSRSQSLIKSRTRTLENRKGEEVADDDSDAISEYSFNSDSAVTAIQL